MNDDLILNREFETKVLNIDVEQVVQTLRRFGADEYPEELMRRYVFDNDTENIEFVRLRNYRDKTTLAYKFKGPESVGVGNTKELEVEISDFETVAEILRNMSFKRIFYQENKRHLFRLKDIEFTIDTWPQPQPYLEIEANSIEKIREGLGLLGFEGKDVGDKDIKQMYWENGIDMHATAELRF